MLICKMGGEIMSKEPVIKAEKFGLTTCGKFNQIERRIKSKCRRKVGKQVIKQQLSQYDNN